MSEIRFTLAHKGQITEWFNTPLTELNNEQLIANIKDLTSVVVEEANLSLFLSAFGLNLRSRPRKVAPVAVVKVVREKKQKVFNFVIENEDGTKDSLIVDYKNKTVCANSLIPETAEVKEITAEIIAAKVKEMFVEAVTNQDYQEMVDSEEELNDEEEELNDEEEELNDEEEGLNDEEEELNGSIFADTKFG